MILLAGVAATAGCSRPVVDPLTPPEPPVVWPSSPDRARVRYLGELKGSDDYPRRRTLSERWDELLHGPSQPSKLVSPHGVAVHADGDRVAIADTNGMCVHVFDLAGKAYTRWDGCGEPVEALACPVAAAWVGDALWVADAKLHAVAVIPSSGKGRFVGRDALARPAGMAFCGANGLCYVTDAGAHAVLAFDRQGKLIARFGSHGSGAGQFNYPSHIACASAHPGAPAGTLIVADALNFRVQRLGLDGKPLGAFGRKGDAAGDFGLPKAAAADADGNIWVVDAHFENVQAFTTDGKLLLAFGREGRGQGEFWLPAGICIDAKRRMWVADTYNRRVQVFELLP